MNMPLQAPSQIHNPALAARHRPSATPTSLTHAAVTIIISFTPST
jgi:hypothetical protein